MNNWLFRIAVARVQSQFRERGKMGMIYSAGGDDILESTTISLLNEDIITILRMFDSQEEESIFPELLLTSCVYGSFEVVPGKGLRLFVGENREQEFVPFANSEDLRKYLYDMIGFVYQSRKVACELPDDEIIDHLARNGYEEFVSDGNIVFDEGFVPPVLKSEKNVRSHGV